MQIKTDKPPIWAEAHKHFEIDDSETVYTYGEVLHNPANIFIDEYLLAHEATHSEQQKALKGGPKEWWERYFADVDFRMQQEVEAYAMQYALYCLKNKDRNYRFRYLNRLATFLASPLYKGNIPHSQCLSRIKHSPTPLTGTLFAGKGSKTESLPAGEGSEVIKK